MTAEMDDLMALADWIRGIVAAGVSDRDRERIEAEIRSNAARPVRGCATSNEVARTTESDGPPVGGWGLWPTFRHTEPIKETSEMSEPNNRDHDITVTPERRTDGLTYYRAVCSCGQYRSGLNGYPGHAERAGRDHKTAKQAQQPT